MPAKNPYAPSSASLRIAEKPVHGDGIWRYGKSVILAQGHEFPHRCVKCNEPSVQPHRAHKVYWHHPALYVLLVVWIIVYLVVALGIAVLAIVKSRVLYPQRIDDRYARLQGADVRFLASLPEF